MSSRTLCLTIVLTLSTTAAAGQTADNVILVINEDSPASVQVGEYYAEKRAVAADHVVRIKTATTETIQRPDYEATIEGPIGSWLMKHRLQDRVLYLVLTKGVPLRVAGTAGRDATTASVDSELTLLYRKLLGISSPSLGRIPNPYFLDATSPASAKFFTRFTADIYLVTRLDGFSVEDVLRLIDRGVAPSASGKILLDQKATPGDPGGDLWLQQAATRVQTGWSSDRVVIETTAAVAATSDALIGYYSWGSNDPANRVRRLGLTFSPGAIAGMFVSTDGRTFTEPPADWTPGGRSRPFAGTLQSLAGDLVRDGITGIAAHVSEPFLDAAVRPQILFPAYVSGFNLAEAFYLAIPYLSWQTMVIGDPLCAPFSRTAIPPDSIAKDIDPETDFPGLFSERRMAALGAGLNPAALKLVLKLESERVQGAPDRTEAVLRGATELEPALVSAHLALAIAYAKQGDYASAIDRYRRVVAVTPDNPVALNDLAWLLAERGDKPQEALPLAEKALRLSPIPAILDTLGWIHHRLGDDERGIGYVERALAAAPDNVDFLIHAAVMHAALNSKPRARQELAAALKINPALATERADVVALQALLQQPE